MNPLIEKLLSESPLAGSPHQPSVASNDMSKLYDKISDRIDTLAGKEAEHGEDIDTYHHIFSTLQDKLEKQMGRSVTLGREDMYRPSDVLAFAKAPLRGFTVLVADTQDSDWVMTWYTPRAADVLRKWATLDGAQLMAMVGPRPASKRAGWGAPKA